MNGVTNMTSDSTILDSVLIDLLSGHHHKIQKALEEAWDNHSDISISKSEWNIIIRIYDKRLPVSHITKSLDISRQAIHKLIKNLSAKGLIEVHKMENNKKERCIALTTFGAECYEKYMDQKIRMENQIIENLGDEQIKMLKTILQLDWGLE